MWGRLYAATWLYGVWRDKLAATTGSVPEQELLWQH